jgi:hypothetical protein
MIRARSSANDILMSIEGVLLHISCKLLVQMLMESHIVAYVQSSNKFHLVNLQCDLILCNRDRNWQVVGYLRECTF